MSSAAREYAPDGSLVGGDHHVVRGITTGPAFVLHSIRSSSSDVQSCHQTPRLESKGHEEKVVVVTSPQSNHPTPREASKRYEGTMASAQARSTKNLMPRRTSNRYGETFTSEQSDRCVTASELRAVFLALEQYKQEQHTALQSLKRELDVRVHKIEDTIYPIQHSVKRYEQEQRTALHTMKDELDVRINKLEGTIHPIQFSVKRFEQEQHTTLQTMKGELDMRIDKLEDTFYPIQCSVKAIESQCTDEQQQVNGIVASAKEELMQITRDLLAKLASAISSNIPVTGSGLAVANPNPKITNFTDEDLTLCSKDSEARHPHESAKAAATIKRALSPIVEECEFSLDQNPQALVNKIGAIKFDAKGLLSPRWMVGQSLEQKLGSPLRTGKALKYIMENSARLERAAFGLDQCCIGFTPLTHGDHDMCTGDATHRQGTTKEAKYDQSKTPHAIKSPLDALRQ